ncbi:hypothetical protein Tco_0045034 [Tanacetum coccineum]
MAVFYHLATGITFSALFLKSWDSGGKGGGWLIISNCIWSLIVISDGALLTTGDLWSLITFGDEISTVWDENLSALKALFLVARVVKQFNTLCNSRLNDTHESDGFSFVLPELKDTIRNWISKTKDNSSISGWVFLLGRGAMFWASKKQTCITSSIMEYEFVTLAAGGKEVDWLRNLILEIPLRSKLIAPIYIHCDSDDTLAKAYREMYNEKSRHLGVRYDSLNLPLRDALSILDLSRCDVLKLSLCYVDNIAHSHKTLPDICLVLIVMPVVVMITSLVL